MTKYIIFDEDKTLETKSVWVKSIETGSHITKFKHTGWGMFSSIEPVETETFSFFEYGDERQQRRFSSIVDPDMVIKKWKELIELINSSVN